MRPIQQCLASKTTEKPLPELAGRGPRFSVVIPTRNRAERLARTVSSVLAQTLDDLEVIIVDDASTDCTPTNVKKLTSSDPRVRCIRNEECRGAAVSRNRGIKEARGTWVAFMDDDCQWEPSRLSRIAQELNQNPESCGFAYSLMITTAATGTPVLHGKAPEGLPFTGPWRVGTPMMVVRTSLLREVGGFCESLPRLQDFDLALRLMLTTNAVFVPQALVWAEDVPGISSNTDALQGASRVLLNRYAGDDRLGPKEWARMHTELAHRFMENGLRSDAVRHLLRAIQLHPTRLLSYASLVSALSGRLVYAVVTGSWAGVRAWAENRR